MQMRNLRQQDDYWKPCRPGTILGVSDTKFRRARRKFLVRLTMGGVVTLTGLASGLFALQHRKNVNAIAKKADSKDADAAMALSKTSNSEGRDGTDNKLIVLDCRDISELVGSYVVAMRIDENKRTTDQANMIDCFSQHLEMCQGCTKMVENAMRV